MAESLRLAAVLLQPFMPGAVAQIQTVLGYKPTGILAEELGWGGRLAGSKVAASLVLFPRIQAEDTPVKS